MWWNTRNIKWQMIVFFLAFAASALLVNMVAIDQLQDRLPPIQLRAIIMIITLALATVAGFLVARRLRRKMDKLQLALIQLEKGNLSSRLKRNGPDPFDALYKQFNDMAAAMEKRMRVMQKLGEKEAIEAEAKEKAVLEERKRLARDLHDTVSQQLFAMHMNASSLPILLKQQPDKVEPILEQLIQMSQLAQKQIRGMIAQLRPLELEDRSLSEALDAWFPDYCRHNGLKGTLNVQLQQRLSEGIEHHLFMIVQEAMANVVKHASAAQVSLSVQETEGSYIVQVTDDGVGFNNQLSFSHSYGLFTMKERAQKLGGDMKVESKAGQGTKVSIHIPKLMEDQEDDR